MFFPLLHGTWHATQNDLPYKTRCTPLQVLQEALTVISLLDVLCEMTSDLKQFMFLQDHPDLLVTTVGKVKNKLSSNRFGRLHNWSLWLRFCFFSAKKNLFCGVLTDPDHPSDCAHSTKNFWTHGQHEKALKSQQTLHTVHTKRRQPTCEINVSAVEIKTVTPRLSKSLTLSLGN